MKEQTPLVIYCSKDYSVTLFLSYLPLSRVPFRILVIQTRSHGFQGSSTAEILSQKGKKQKQDTQLPVVIISQFFNTFKQKNSSRQVKRMNDLIIESPYKENINFV